MNSTDVDATDVPDSLDEATTLKTSTKTMESKLEQQIYDLIAIYLKTDMKVDRFMDRAQILRSKRDALRNDAKRSNSADR